MLPFILLRKRSPVSLKLSVYHSLLHHEGLHCLFPSTDVMEEQTFNTLKLLALLREQLLLWNHVGPVPVEEFRLSGLQTELQQH